MHTSVSFKTNYQGFFFLTSKAGFRLNLYKSQQLNVLEYTNKNKWINLKNTLI